MLNDDNETSTSSEQSALEKKVYPLYSEIDGLDADEISELLRLSRDQHTTYCHKGLGHLPAGYASLDASRPWICYWILHSLALMDAPLPAGTTPSDIVFFLACCQSDDGGYGGGPMQAPHLAPTYAAVNALVTLGGKEALGSINRAKVFGFLQKMCVPPERGGGFTVHDGGEVDLRACYLAMSVAHVLGLDKDLLLRTSGMVDYVQRCQTYEGGLGGEPGNEAHGGYTFCGLAALALVGRMDALDLPRLVHWATQRQGGVEGGFNGRTNKLVDGCYSFWQGGLFSLLQRVAPGLLRQRPASTAQAASPQAPLVPPLPFNLVPKTPVEQAQHVLITKQAIAQQLVDEAIRASERADTALQSATESASNHLATEARVLLDQAGAARLAVEQANTAINIISASAAVLQPLPDLTDPPLPSVTHEGLDTIHLGPPLYNWKALQLWILRCCQQPAGGLRDKPGKSPDQYHTCYCLSGLSSAQHCSNSVLGPRENLLKKADPVCNIVTDKLAAALKHYKNQPVDTGAPTDMQM